MYTPWVSHSGTKDPLDVRHDAAEREAFAHALKYGREHLSALHRRSGEDYAQHGAEVAVVVKEFWPQANLSSVAALHDLLVHDDGDALLRRAPLSNDEKELVRRMHALRRLHIHINTRDLDTVIDAFARSGDILPLRMAHRLNDVRHLQRFPPALRREIARESLHMYAAIAGRLGMQRLRQEMEDLCFRCLHPVTAASLSRRFEGSHKLDMACLDHTRRFLQDAIAAQGVTCVIERRIKGLYSTYRKMIIRRRQFHDLTDRLALRIVVDDIDACYRVLGIVHNAMRPMPGKLKDYIGAPKENGYRSIHTVIFPLPGVTEQPIEIQIRTRAMHEECEYGSASHEEYKSRLYSLHDRPTRVNLLRNLLSLRDEARTPKQFETALRQYFREDRLMIFDHQGNLYHLRKPASAMDFCVHAYGSRCRRFKGVFINGRARPPQTPLQDGDTVHATFGRATSLTQEATAWCRQASLRRRLAADLGLRGNHGTKALVRSA